MLKRKIAAISIRGFALLAALCAAHHAMAQDATTAYPKMAPVEQYLMDRDAEISLARSAAPDAISHDAAVLVLTRHGYETAVEGKNGWVCMVDRDWMGMFDNPEFWNPKVRAAGCLNPPAARSLLAYDYKRAELILAGHSKSEVVAAIKAAMDKKEFPPLEQGAVCYMMSRSSYLTDSGGHNVPHVMFYQPARDDAAWGANVANSPTMSVNYWYFSAEAYPQLRSFPPLAVYLLMVPNWSDGTSASSM